MYVQKYQENTVMYVQKYQYTQLCTKILVCLPVWHFYWKHFSY